jgi:hypothetical protein
MKARIREYSTHIYEMMARLGIEPGVGVLPQSSLRCVTPVRPAMVNFAPDFCINADILFDLQYDQAGPRRVN